MILSTGFNWNTSMIISRKWYLFIYLFLQALPFTCMDQPWLKTPVNQFRAEVITKCLKTTMQNIINPRIFLFYFISFYICKSRLKHCYNSSRNDRKWRVEQVCGEARLTPNWNSVTSLIIAVAMVTSSWCGCCCSIVEGKESATMW